MGARSGHHGPMANTFLPVDRDQRFLLPVDMREWVPPDHLVWFLIEVVGRLDLSRLETAYRLGGAGRRAYDPAMLLTLLLYAATQGVRSSRAIERACRSDAAYRVICGTWGETPDHATVCRFRRRHQAQIADLFCQVIALARELGMVRLGLLAVDGTKVRAQASLGSNRTEAWIREEVGRILAEAEEADRTEEEQLGDEAGWELPAHLGEAAERLERLERALEALGDREPPERGGEPKVSLTDPDSRTMVSAGGGFLQGYNCQMAVSEDGLVVAARATDHPNDLGLLSEMLEATEANLARAEIPDRPEVVVADAGYFDTDDLAPLEDDPDAPLLLVATTKRAKQPTEAPADPEEPYREAVAALDRQDQAERLRRAEAVARWEAGEIAYREAVAELGLGIPQAYAVRAAFRAGGTDAIPVPKRRRPPRPPRSVLVRYRLESRLADPENRKLYRRRSHLAETANADMKHRRGLRQFLHRGLAAVDAELLLDCVVQNLLRIREATGGLLPGPA